MKGATNSGMGTETEIRRNSSLAAPESETATGLSPEERAKIAARSAKYREELDRAFERIAKSTAAGVPQQETDPNRRTHPSKEGEMTSLMAAEKSLDDAINKNKRLIASSYHFFRDVSEKIADKILPETEEPSKIRKGLVKVTGVAGLVLDNIVDLSVALVNSVAGNGGGVTDYMNRHFYYKKTIRTLEHMRDDVQALQKIPAAKNKATGIAYDNIAGTYTPISYGNDGSLFILQGGLRLLKKEYRKELKELRTNKGKGPILAPSGQTGTAQGQQASAEAASQNGNKTQPTNTATGPQPGQPTSSGQVQAQPVDPAAPVVASASLLKVGAAENISGTPKGAESGSNTAGTQKQKKKHGPRPKV